MGIAPADQQPATFAFDEERTKLAEEIVAKYPEGRQASAVLPLLDLAQRQHGWVPAAAIEMIADMLAMPSIRVWEVVTFYTMFSTRPMGRHRVHVCTTTPCWLRGSDDIVRTCERELGIGMGETTKDGEFSLLEIECAGACVNAPVVQINDDYYEDLDSESMGRLISELRAGRTPTPGSQIGRQGSAPVTGPRVLSDKQEGKAR